MTCSSASRETGHYQILLSGDSEELILPNETATIYERSRSLSQTRSPAGKKSRTIAELTGNGLCMSIVLSTKSSGFAPYRNLPGGRKGAGQLIGTCPADGKLGSLFACSKTKYGRRFWAV